MGEDMASPPPTPVVKSQPIKTRHGYQPAEVFNYMEAPAPVANAPLLPQTYQSEPLQKVQAPVPVAKAPPPPPVATAPQPVYQTQLPVQEKPKQVAVQMDKPVAPSFREPLKNVTAEEGQRATLEGWVSAKPEPVIKWYKNEIEITSKADYEITYKNGRTTLVIPEVFSEDAGTYVCVSTNPAGTVKSTAQLTVNPAAVPPQFTERLTTKEVREGESVQFQVRVTGNPAPEITWYREDSQIVSSPDFEIQQHGDVHVLYIPEVFYEDSGKFSVRAVNRAGQTTCTAELIVEAPAAPPAPPAPPLAPSPRQPETVPVFQIKLTNQPCISGQTAHFECKVSAFPPPEILWTRRGHPLVDKARYQSTYDQYNGVTTLTILHLCAEDEGEYTCTAINNQGEASTSATLLGPDRYQDWLRDQGRDQEKDKQNAMVYELESKLAASPGPMAMAPRPSRSPADFYRPMSEKMIDSAVENEPVHQPYIPEPDFKVSSFEKRLVDEIDYREGKVAPHHHEPNEDAFQAVQDASAPVFEQRLKNFQLMEGSDATFVCKVSGSPMPFVAWYQCGRLIRPSNRYEMKMTRDGYVTLRVRIAFPEDAGHYTCCATNIMGRDTCSGELYIEGLGQIDDTSYVSQESLKRLTRSPGSGSRGHSQEPGGVSEKYYRPIFRKIPSDQEVPEGKMCRFDSIVTGRPMPDIFWFRDDVQVHDDSNHKIVVNEDGFHSLIIYATQKWDNGLYTCIARNRGGEDRFQVTLNVTAQKAAEPPRFVDRLTNQDVKENEPFEFVAEASGHPPPMMSWQRDGRHIDRDPRFRIRNEAFRSSLSCERADARDTAWYQCTAANIAGTATNRARLNVQVDPRRPEPERKLYIPKRTTPTPPPQVDHAPQVKRRPSSEPPKRARADIVLSPSPAPMEQAPRIMPVQQPIQHTPAPAVFAPQAAKKPFKPDASDLVAYIQESEKPKAPRDVIDSGPARDAATRPPTQELIKQGAYPEPGDEEMFKKERPRPPKFKTQIKPQGRLKETEAAHFESRLVPIGDPDMVVEWFKDGVLLKHGSRFMPVTDFGFVALDILWTYPEDSGVYMCQATNKHGSDTTETHLKCYGKESVIYDSQLPDGNESVQHLDLMEEQIRRDRIPRERIEEGPEPSPPVFDLMPEMQQVEEGDTAKFMCKVSGHPRPRLTWWVNGTIIVNGHRFKLRYDGMINVLEIPKVREYDSGTIRVVAKNPLGEAECSTTLVVIPHEDWRSRLKQAPRSTVGIELESHVRTELRSVELDNALKRPRTTVTELRAFERSAQEKAQAYRDEEVKDAYQAINLQHAQMHRTDAYHEQSEAHIDRARHMLGMETDYDRKTDVPKIARSGKTQEAPAFGRPLMNMKAKEGKAVKLEVNFTGFPYADVQWYREGLEIQPSPDFRITTLNNKSFLLIPEVFVEDAGLFTVRATNKFGMVECKAVLEIAEDPNKVRDSSPEFKVQMRDLVVRVGEPATFDVQLTGQPRPDVYWAKDGKRLYESKRWKFIVEQDHYTILIYEVREEDRGVYECIVVNKLGKATCSAKLNAEGKSSAKTKVPDLTEQQAPQLVTPLKDAQVNEGESATVSCKIIAVPEPVVQWYYNNQIIKPSKYFQMYTENGVHTLHIAGAFPEDEGVYKCTARNQAGEVTCIAHLKVLALTNEPDMSGYQTMEHPRFVKPIGAVEVKPGSPAHFVVEVAGTPLPEITWYREGHQILHSDDFQIIQEENKCILYIKEVFPEDSGIFTCRSTNPAGVAESSAELIVEDPTQVSKAEMQFAGPPQSAPRILKAPSPVREIVAGSTTKLLVQLAAYPSPRFTWFVNGAAIRPSQRHKVSYENGIITLIIYDAQPQDSGEYILKAKNDLGETTCKTILNIQPTQKVVELTMQTREVTIQSAKREALKAEVTPTFTKPMPAEIRVRERAIAKLEAYVEAYPPPLISWHVNGSLIKPSPKYTVKHEGNKAILLVKNVTIEDAGTYSCRAHSDLGEAVCSTTLYITGVAPKASAPKFTLHLRPATAIDGHEVTLTCSVQGNPMPDIHWFHNDKNIDKSEDFVINYDRRTGKIEMVIVDCLLEDSGIFKCVARNHGGQDVTQCTLTVTSAPEEHLRPERTHGVKVAPKTKLIVQQGDKEVMRTAVESEIDRTLHQKEVKVIKRIVKKQSGQPPKFSKPIQPQVVKEAENATFTAIVSGAPQPEIIWLKDKVPLAPSHKLVMDFDTNTGTCILTIVNAEPSDVGVYSCRAENPAGKATCTANVVVVQHDNDITMGPNIHMKPPCFIQPIKTVHSSVGQTAIFKCRIEGKPMPGVVWYHDGSKIKMDKRVLMKFGRESGEWELHILGVIPEDGGAFRCVASNPVGEASTEATLTVEGHLRHAVGPESRIQYVVDEQAEPWRAVPTDKEPVKVIHTVVSQTHELSENSEQKLQAVEAMKSRKYQPQFKVEEDTKTETYLKSEHEHAIKAGGLSSYDKNVIEHSATVEENVSPLAGQTVSADVAAIEAVFEKAAQRSEQHEKSLKGSNEQNITHMQVQKKDIITDGSQDPAKTHVTVTTTTGQEGNVSVVETETVAVKTSSSKGFVKEIHTDTQVMSSENSYVTDVKEFNKSVKTIEHGTPDVVDAPQAIETTDEKQAGLQTKAATEIVIQSVEPTSISPQTIVTTVAGVGPATQNGPTMSRVEQAKTVTVSVTPTVQTNDLVEVSIGSSADAQATIETSETKTVRFSESEPDVIESEDTIATASDEQLVETDASVSFAFNIEGQSESAISQSQSDMFSDDVESSFVITTVAGIAPQSEGGEGSTSERVTMVTESVPETVTMVTKVIEGEPTEEVSVTEEVGEGGQIVKKITKKVTGPVTKTMTKTTTVAKEEVVSMPVVTGIIQAPEVNIEYKMADVDVERVITVAGIEPQTK